MRTALLLAALTSLCFSLYITRGYYVGDGKSEVTAQHVLDELSNAVMAKNRTAIADCLSEDFVWHDSGRALKKAITFKDRDAVLSHMTDDFKLTACRGTYDRDRIADIYSSFHDNRFFSFSVKSFEFGNGEDVKVKLYISEPWNNLMGILPRNPYTIDFHLKSVGGIYETNLVEYHTECDWPGI